MKKHSVNQPRDTLPFQILGMINLKTSINIQVPIELFGKKGLLSAKIDFLSPSEIGEADLVLAPNISSFGAPRQWSLSELITAKIKSTLKTQEEELAVNLPEDLIAELLSNYFLQSQPYVDQMNFNWQQMSAQNFGPWTPDEPIRQYGNHPYSGNPANQMQMPPLPSPTYYKQPNCYVYLIIDKEQPVPGNTLYLYGRNKEHIYTFNFPIGANQVAPEMDLRNFQIDPNDPDPAKTIRTTIDKFSL